MSIFWKNIALIPFLLWVLLGVQSAFGQSPCANCTHTFPSGQFSSKISIDNGEVYCLNSGTSEGPVTLNPGGTICVAEGATLTLKGWSDFNGGQIINHGTINIDGYASFSSGTAIENYSQFNFNGGGAFQEGTFFNNRVNGAVIFDGNWNFSGNMDNSGHVNFKGGLNRLSSILNNYGHLEIHQSANNLTSGTFLVNDGLVEFIDIASINYSGTLLTNSGTFLVRDSDSGDFNLNSPDSEVFNNGLMDISGELNMNPGGLVVNNCQIMAGQFGQLGGGEFENNGFIGLQNGNAYNGNGSFTLTDGIFTNNSMGYVRGVDFTISSGEIKGSGRFYFTGVTGNNGGGMMSGLSAAEPLLFFDAGKTGGASTDPSDIFDHGSSRTSQNVKRPATMDKIDVEEYECSAEPSTAGFPPETSPTVLASCNKSITFELEVSPAVSDNNNDFELELSSLRLFDPDNPQNPTNNTTNLVIPGRGTFTVVPNSKVIEFTPQSKLTFGRVSAQYRISNSRNGDPLIYSSLKTDITITIQRCAIRINPNAFQRAGSY